MRFTLLFLLISGSLLAQEKRFFTRETFQLMTDHQTRFERQYSLFKGDSAIISDYMNDVLQLQATIYGAVNLQVIDGVISIPRVNEYMLFCRSMGAGSSYRPHFAKVKAKLKFYFDGKPDRYILVNADRFRFAEKWISGGQFAPRKNILVKGTGEHSNALQHEAFKDSILVEGYHFRNFQKSDTIYDHVDIQASPKNGLENFSKELSEVLHYPLYARFLGKQGVAYIEFVVDETGKLTDFRQLYYDGGNFEKEVFNGLKKLKPWNPAIFRGRPVKTQFMIPITFKLAPAEN